MNGHPFLKIKKKKHNPKELIHMKKKQKQTNEMVIEKKK